MNLVHVELGPGGDDDEQFVTLGELGNCFNLGTVICTLPAVGEVKFSYFFKSEC